MHTHDEIAWPLMFDSSTFKIAIRNEPPMRRILPEHSFTVQHVILLKINVPITGRSLDVNGTYSKCEFYLKRNLAYFVKY